MNAPSPRRVLINAINDNDTLRGPDRYLLSLVQELGPVAHECTFEICHAPWQKPIIGARLPENMTRVELSPPRNPWVRALWQATQFRQWADSRNADVIFLPNIIYTPFLRTPTVMTIHDLAHFRFPEKFGVIKGRIQRIQIRLALKAPNRLIVVSSFTREDLHRFCRVSGSRVVEIGEGAPEPKYGSDTASRSAFYLCVGKVERSKNIEHLIDSFARSERLKSAGYRLLIAGAPGNAEGVIQAKIAALADDRVERLGFVSDAQLSELYLNTSALVFPSLVEGFGLVLVEAMAHGAPIIAVNASAVPEVVGGAAVLVDPDDPNGLQHAMERLAEDSTLRNTLSSKGYERVKLHSWRKAAELTWKTIREAAL